ncbi:AI-2E family transporter [Pelagibacterium sp.]|uniref:AI-2E family transporter n=1 Tax=Pelagibacterium sp. TaxID=1967288 RepID=UPI003A907C45
MARPILIGIAALALLGLVVFFSELLLLIFAGILIAAILDSGVKMFRRFLPVPRVLALVMTIFLAIGAIGFALVAGGMTVLNQLDALSRALGEAWRIVADQLNDWGIPVLRTFNLEDIWERLPEPQTIFGGAGAVLGTGFGMISNVLIVSLIGIFLAADPARYRDGLVIFAPVAYRARLRDVLDRAGRTLQRWLVGQLALMLIVGVATTVVLLVVGFDFALSLGIIAGVLNFIPFMGPILAFVPIGLAMIGQDLTTVVIVLTGYTFIQQMDANLLSPLVQDRVVHLPPALTVAFLLLMGVIFGPIGVALATPLLAALRVLALELYVGDFLGDPENR